MEGLKNIPVGCFFRERSGWEVGVVKLSVPRNFIAVAGISTLLSEERGWWNQVAREVRETCATCGLCYQPKLESTGTLENPHLTVIPDPRNS